MKRTIYLVFLSLCAVALHAQVTIEHAPGRVTIGNRYLSRTFLTAGDRLLPGEIINRRTPTPTIYTPLAAKSNEFVINTVAQTAAPAMLDRTGWTITADSWCEENAQSGLPRHAIDGNAQTLWHSNYPNATGGQGSTALPHYLQIDLGTAQTFSSFGYQPRQTGDNGNVKGYELYAADSPEALSTEAALVASGELRLSGTGMVWTGLGRTVTARYVRLRVLTSQNGGAFASCAEFALSPEEVGGAETAIRSSLLTLADVASQPTAGGQQVVFSFAPVEQGGATWNVKMVVEMGDEDAFMRKYLLISVPEGDRPKARIDYIDLENLSTEGVPQADQWTHPQMGAVAGGMSGYLAALGQPVYVAGLYFGSEFPQADNQIISGAIHSLYYSGKNFIQLGYGGHLDAEGTFATWKNVMGATRSVRDQNIIRQDFFAYIDRIKRPAKFRIQYNSWYDWELQITADRINQSFRKMEEGFSRHGLRPIDSYVMDDGWNAYANITDANSTPNTSDFWEFNAKFPNGMADPTRFASTVGSKTGLWLGPRGGYNYPAQWASYLQSHGTGTYNNNCGDIVTGDSVYLDRLKAFFLDNQRRYDINYWKLDGFCIAPPQPSVNGRYITGGDNGMYYITEHWERWYAILRALYADGDARGTDVWLNLTCYVNPSPWILQFSNSVWLQCNYDQRDVEVAGRNIKMEKQLNYRDDVYFDNMNTRQYQFPVNAYFHHDPCYGQKMTAANSATDEQFRMYLYMIAMRGSGLWDLLYSYNYLDEGEKWSINTEVLKFAEEHQETLAHSLIFGQTPASGECYGYSAWDPSTGEGIVAVRNPAASARTFSFDLTASIGVPESLGTVYRRLVTAYLDTQTAEAPNQPYAYGSTVSINLGPGEMRLWRFTAAKDLESAHILTARANGTTARQVVLGFDKPLSAADKSQFAILQDGAEVMAVSSIKLTENGRVATLNTTGALAEDVRYQVKVDGATDFSGNATTEISPEFYYNKAALVQQIDSIGQLEATGSATERMYYKEMMTLMTVGEATPARNVKAISGRGEFNIGLYLTTTAASGTLLSQAGGYELSIVGGKPQLRVGQTVVTGDTLVNDGRLHRLSCSREANGMLKLYVDGKLQASAYNPAEVNLDIPASKVMVGGAAQVEMAEIMLHDKALSADENVSALARKVYYPISFYADERQVELLAGTTVLPLTDGVYTIKMQKGGTRRFKIRPKEGCEVTDWTIDGVSQGAIAAGATAEYIFNSVDSVHTVRIYSALVDAIKDARTEGTIRVWQADGTLFVSELAAGDVVTVYTPAGELWQRAVATAPDLRLNARQWSRGVLLVQVGNTVWKVTL